MIVFFEKAMITGLPLLNKLRTYRKRREKTMSDFGAFFSHSGLDPPPPFQRQTRRKIPGSARGYTL